MKNRWIGKRVLVTGGTGFIGSFVVEKLLALGAKVRVPIRSRNFRTLSRLRASIEWLEGDLRDGEYCTKLLKGCDALFHAAACRRTTEYHRSHATRIMAENIRMTGALIEALEEHPVQTIFFSSGNIPKSLDIIALAQHPVVDGYIFGKAVNELRWIVASREFKFPLLIVRPIGVYGPRDTFSEEGNVVPALMVRAQKASGNLSVWGSGRQLRSFLYIQDLVTAVFRLLDHDVKGIQYVASPQVTTTQKLAQSIVSLLKARARIVFDIRREEEERSCALVPLHRCLRTMRWTSLEEGLWNTYEWWNHSSRRNA